VATNEVIDRDYGWREMMRRVEALRGGAYAKVGVLGDSSRGGMHEQKDGKASALTVAEIAAVMEFGTSNGRVPARPFVRATFDDELPELVRMAQALIPRVVIDGDMPAERALNLMGLHLASAMRNRITTSPLPGIAPPNAPATALLKAMKGRTGRFLRSNAKNLGTALADVAATDATLRAAGGMARRLLKGSGGLKAARSIGGSFAQSGALAAVRTLVDTGRLVGAISWAVVFADRQYDEHYVGPEGG